MAEADIYGDDELEIKKIDGEEQSQQPKEEATNEPTKEPKEIIKNTHNATAIILKVNF